MSFFQEITKVPRAVLIRTLILGNLLWIFILLGFKVEKENTYTSISKIEVPLDCLQLNAQKGKWYHEGIPFNGFAIQKYSKGELAEKIGFYNGKKQGKAYKWFEDGTLFSEKNYVENRLQGVAKTWWPNGQMSSKSNYQNRQRHGEQLTWYPNGQLARRMQFVNGKEAGLQQAWLKTGKLYANYEAKNGRFFGMKRSNLCYQLKNEVVQK